MTTLNDLKKMGGVVSDEPVEKEIHFTIDDQEYTATIHVRRLSIGDHEKLFGVDATERASNLIARAVLLNGGKDSISVKDAYRLHDSLATAMIAAVNEVNRVKKS